VNRNLPDISARERIALWPTAIAALIMGVAPPVWFASIDPAVRLALGPLAQELGKLVGQ
jgi:NADH:ubiquinone oxidoreductase subunit 4 (subunit M)